MGSQEEGVEEVEHCRYKNVSVVSDAACGGFGYIAGLRKSKVL